MLLRSLDVQITLAAGKKEKAKKKIWGTGISSRSFTPFKSSIMPAVQQL
jgi:hypothetical protein